MKIEIAKDAKIYRAKVAVNTGIVDCDVIAERDEFWLVPQWMHNPKEGLSRPARMIPLRLVPHQRMIGSPLGDFVVNAPLPKELFADPVPPQLAEQYGVVEMPLVIRLVPRNMN